MRILVIGGGASGMIAALTAAENPNHQVTLLERQARLGRKLAATGNGRCNLSNLHTTLARYHGEDPTFIQPALTAFDVSSTLDYFSNLGLLTVAEPSGRIYPFSDQAGSVVDILRLAIEQSRIQLVTGSEVTTLYYQDDAFFAQTEARRYAADRVIVACGGMAGAKLGGTRSGYEMLKHFGHSCTKLYPALVQLKTDPTWVKSLKGVRAEARVQIHASEEVLAETRGEVQFTEYGISGPAIFEISRVVTPDRRSMQAVLDLVPMLDLPDLTAMLTQKCHAFPNLTLENFLTGILQNRLGRTLLRFCGYKLESAINSLKKRDLQTIAQTMKAFSLPITGNMGMEQAQVTAGGIRTSEFNPTTLESTLQPGLYACGEVLDIDGDCGGLNLQWAWSSGRLAGQLKGAETI